MDQITLIILHRLYKKFHGWKSPPKMYLGPFLSSNFKKMVEVFCPYLKRSLKHFMLHSLKLSALVFSFLVSLMCNVSRLQNGHFTNHLVKELSWELRKKKSVVISFGSFERSRKETKIICRKFSVFMTPKNRLLKLLKRGW